MTFHAPQIILCFLLAMCFGIHAAKHGEPMNREYNAFTDLLTSAITIGLLYWGGFFS